MINKKIINIWDRRYKENRDSGAGSSGDEGKLKLDIIKDTCSINSILDIGCGDMQMGCKIIDMFPDAEYIGLDVSKNIIEKNKKLYPDKKFEVNDSYNFEYKADLVLCLDVMFHQIDNDGYKELIKRLKNSYNKYLILTEYDGKMKNKCFDIKYRKFNPKWISKNYISYKIPFHSGHKLLFIYKK